MRFLTSLAAFSVAFAGSAAAQADRPETDIIFVAPTVEVEGYQPYDDEADANLEDTLDDADVYSSITNEDIGEVDDVHTGVGGAGDTYLELEIGGFLDIGDKDVAVPLDQVSIYRGGDDYRVYIEATEEQLEDYPEYDD